MSSNLFLKNNASDNGGGLWGEMLKDMSIQINVFEENCARQGGSIGFSKVDSTSILSNIFQSNEAILGEKAYIIFSSINLLNFLYLRM